MFRFLLSNAMANGTLWITSVWKQFCHAARMSRAIAVALQILRL
jgi:hypothetical protein